MLRKKWIFIYLFSTLLWAKNADIIKFNGAWHLRVMDGMEVRKARAILDFSIDTDTTQISGFDGCNRIMGAIHKSDDSNLSVPLIISTRMACRQKIHNWVSTRLHKTLNEGFSIKEDEKYGVEGITVKSVTHELFLKKMEKESKWF